MKITYTSFDGVTFSTVEGCEKHEAEMLKKRDTVFVPYVDVLEKMAKKRPEIVFNSVLRACVARVVTDKTKDDDIIIVDAGFSGMHTTERPIFSIYTLQKDRLRLQLWTKTQFYCGKDKICFLDRLGCCMKRPDDPTKDWVISVEDFINLKWIGYDKHKKGETI